MNREQAKEILLGYRPMVDVPQSSEFSDALALAEKDPELKAWFEQHCEFQKVIRAKLMQIPVPEGLKEQILSERKATFALPSKSLLKLAAVCFVFLVALSVWLFPNFQRGGERTFENFRSRMVKTVARAYPAMDKETDNPAEIRRYLAEKGAATNYELPSPLEKTTPTGCAILTWQGKTVTMIWFKSRPNVSKQPDLFLFVIDRAAVPNAPRTTTPEFSQTNSLWTASWTSGTKSYVLSGTGDESFLRRYF